MPSEEWEMSIDNRRTTKGEMCFRSGAHGAIVINSADKSDRDTAQNAESVERSSSWNSDRVLITCKLFACNSLKVETNLNLHLQLQQ